MLASTLATAVQVAIDVKSLSSRTSVGHYEPLERQLVGDFRLLHY